jgi:hypothetical protein
MTKCAVSGGGADGGTDRVTGRGGPLQLALEIGAEALGQARGIEAGERGEAFKGYGEFHDGVRAGLGPGYFACAKFRDDKT